MFLYVKGLLDLCSFWIIVLFFIGVLLNNEQLASIREQLGRGIAVVETFSQSPCEP